MDGERAAAPLSPWDQDAQARVPEEPRRGDARRREDRLGDTARQQDGRAAPPALRLEHLGQARGAGGAPHRRRICEPCAADAPRIAPAPPPTAPTPPPR